MQYLLLQDFSIAVNLAYYNVLFKCFYFTAMFLLLYIFLTNSFWLYSMQAVLELQDSKSV